MRALVVVNPAAGQDEPVLAVLNRVFREAGVDFEIALTREDGDARRRVGEAGRDGFDLVAAYGGDGTVAAAASALVRGGGPPLAILPGGTGNAVAQSLGIPLDLEQAARVACGGAESTRDVDGLRFGDGFGLLRIGVGADARMIREASRERKDRWGWGAYLLEALGQVQGASGARYRLTIDDRPIELEALTCLLVNIGRLGRGGISLAEEVSPFDGELDLLVIRDADLGAIAEVGASILGLRGVDEEPDLDRSLLHFRARHVRVESEPPEEVHCDGDPVDRTPIDVRVQPAAVRIVVPGEGDPG